MGRLQSSARLSLTLTLAFACNDAVVKSVEEGTTDDGWSCLERYGGSDGSFRCTRPILTFNPEVDILFIVDDASVEPQARLAAAMSTFVQAVRETEPYADLRIAVTTTSDGNPACDQPLGSGGALDATSCRARPHAFDSPEAFATACTEHCSIDALELRPTTTALDPEPRARPWIETTAFESNLPEGVELAEALACIIPQGNVGCHLRAPLGAALSAARRVETRDDPAYGFAREYGRKLVVIVSAGLDCTVNPEGESAFDPEGARALWSDPDAELPTQAACWNAGVACEGDDIWSCVPFDRYPDGGDASVVRYSSLRPIAGLGRSVRLAWTNDYGSEFYVMGGVPAGWTPADPMPYAPPDDPAHALELGVAPVCVLGDAAVPPAVRTHELDRVRSICDEDYETHAQALASIVDELLWPLCVPGCFADVDEDTPGLQTDCTFEFHSMGAEPEAVPRCQDGDRVPAGARLCWSPRSEDERARDCDHFFNLSITVHWTATPVHGSLIHQCTSSSDPTIDCP